jgi:hypothetical protein
VPADLTKFQLPCTNPESMNDWHITEKAPVPPEEEEDIRLIAETAYEMETLKPTAHGARRAGDKAVKAAVTDALARRRHAIEACFADCPMKARLLCLDEGLKPINLEHGVWGGYDAPERRDIDTAIRNRKRKISTGTAARIIIQAEAKSEALDPV